LAVAPNYCHFDSCADFRPSYIDSVSRRKRVICAPMIGDHSFYQPTQISYLVKLRQPTVVVASRHRLFS